jgi:hypothetical protein
VLLIRKLKLHLGSILLAIFLVVGGAIWQAWYSQSSGRTASGSSVPGLVTGGVAAAIILFELLLWPRKKFRRWKLFPTKYWMVAHIWLGLATGPLAFIHAGYRFGGTFSTTLMCLLLFVLVSGIYGWIIQTVLPKWMLGNLPYETIANQIDDVSVQAALNARRMLTVAYGPKPEGLRKLPNLDSLSAQMGGAVTVQDGDTEIKAIVIGAVQRRDSNRSRIEIDTDGEFNADDGKELWRQYAAVIEPFMLGGIAHSKLEASSNQTGVESPVRTRQKSVDWFRLLRDSCSSTAQPIVDRLEDLTVQRLQYDAQRRAQAWLHGWIAFHASVSVVLGVLLVTHIVLALKYM